MTKLTNMNLPSAKKEAMYYCEICKEWVPEKNKHDRKRHGK